MVIPYKLLLSKFELVDRDSILLFVTVVLSVFKENTTRILSVDSVTLSPAIFVNALSLRPRSNGVGKYILLLLTVNLLTILVCNSVLAVCNFGVSVALPVAIVLDASPMRVNCRTFPGTTLLTLSGFNTVVVFNLAVMFMALLSVPPIASLYSVFLTPYRPGDIIEEINLLKLVVSVLAALVTNREGVNPNVEVAENM